MNSNIIEPLYLQILRNALKSIFFIKFTQKMFGKLFKQINALKTHSINYLVLKEIKGPGWSVESKPVGRNDVFTIRPKYYDKAKNRRAKMMLRPKNINVIALLLKVYY